MSPSQAAPNLTQGSENFCRPALRKPTAAKAGLPPFWKPRPKRPPSAAPDDKKSPGLQALCKVTLWTERLAGARKSKPRSLKTAKQQDNKTLHDPVHLTSKTTPSSLHTTCHAIFQSAKTPKSVSTIFFGLAPHHCKTPTGVQKGWPPATVFIKSSTDSDPSECPRSTILPQTTFEAGRGRPACPRGQKKKKESFQLCPQAFATKIKNGSWRLALFRSFMSDPATFIRN